MSQRNTYLPFLLSAVLMCLTLVLIYPYYQYYIDPDGTAYLTIARRYATGHYQAAVNGYWSPWACWLTALLMKCGLQAIPASVVVNAAGALGMLGISQSFFVLMKLERRAHWFLMCTLALFLVFAIFWQSFDDLWECFFLLAALRIMLLEGFVRRPRLWVACGAIGALAYFAKAYAFPFFILSTLCCAYMLSGKQWKVWIKVSTVSIATMVVLSLPRIYLLYEKYGIWTTSTAGPLNTSWYLVGHPYFKEQIHALLPPPYPDSPYYWEDPYTVNDETPHFWDSWYLAGLQVLRLGMNLWKLLVSSVQLSILFPIVGLLATKWLLIKKNNPVTDPRMKVMILSCVLFPAGYLLVNFESRYIWYMLPIGMGLGAWALQNTRSLKSNKSKNLIYTLACASFLVYPAWNMRTMYREGEREHEMAQILIKNHLQVRFTTLTKPGLETQRIERLAYFAGCSLYSRTNRDEGWHNLKNEMFMNHVEYYFQYNPAAGAYFMDNVEAFGKEHPDMDLVLREGELAVWRVRNRARL